MKKLALLGLILLIGAGFYWLALDRPDLHAPSAETHTESGEIESASSAQMGSPLAESLYAKADPQAAVNAFQGLLQHYLIAMQTRSGRPIGDNQDLVRVLTGSNPLRRVFIPSDHPSIDGTGRLLDHWGTPYHIHARSSRSFEVRSAGPDRQLFSADDVLAD